MLTSLSAQSAIKTEKKEKVFNFKRKKKTEG